MTMPKTITIKKSVYDELVKAKKEGESFSDLLERRVKSEDKRQLLLSLRGGVTFTDRKNMMREIRETRGEKRQ